MGDMADYYIELGLSDGEGFAPRWGERRGYYGPRYSSDLPREQPRCAFCGSRDVHWRLFDGSYKLADNARENPGNRYVRHVCPTTADGFEEVE